MISGGGARELFEDDPALQERSALHALSRSGFSARSRQQPVARSAGGGGDPRGGSGKMVIDIMKAGGLVVAGTDTPNARQPARRADGLHDGRHDARSTR